jgi:hypothetical protein
MPSSLSAWFGYDELRYESGGWSVVASYVAA